MRPITGEQAQSRHALGAPYTVVLKPPGPRPAVAVLHVAGQHHYVGLWLFDEYGRRDREVDLRGLEPGRLFLRHFQQWRYANREAPEFCDEAWHLAVDHYLDGSSRQVVASAGRFSGSTHTDSDMREDLRWLPKPDFGCWAELLNALELDSEWDYRINDTAITPTESFTGTPQPFGWRPPTPYSEPLLDLLFTPGAVFTHRQIPDLVAITVRTVATYTVTDGAVAICDPHVLPSERRDDAIIVELPSGTYPLEESSTTYLDDLYGTTFTMKDNYAYRLLISTEPTVSWTMATRPGDDMRLLRDDERISFAVDGGDGCLVDVNLRGELVRRFHSRDDKPVQRHDELDKIVDQATGAELLCFPTAGDGDFAVWIGCDANGNITALTIPMPFMLLDIEPHKAELAPPIS
ncbi:DUF4241 domain-containing protein [Nocardia tengchongensis]|uniref:DUF4241 domain-containing protein n=1 Tax=Nocardia tengchongensis TaxID=2055889 RepID=UPI0036AEA281